jgi:hypothetical protein
MHPDVGGLEGLGKRTLPDGWHTHRARIAAHFDAAAARAAAILDFVERSLTMRGY